MAFLDHVFQITGSFQLLYKVSGSAAVLSLKFSVFLSPHLINLLAHHQFYQSHTKKLIKFSFPQPKLSFNNQFQFNTNVASRA